MRAAAKLTYGGVARALGFSEAPREPAADAMVEGLRVAHELSRHLRAQRMKRGALDFELPEAKVVLDETRRADRRPAARQGSGREEGLPAHRGADAPRQRDGRPLVPRARSRPSSASTQPPDEKKLDRFAAMCEQLGIDFDVEDTRTRRSWRSAQVVREHPLGAGAQHAAPPVDEAGDLRRRERRPLRARVEGVPALHVAHPPVPRSRGAPHGARRARWGARMRRDGRGAIEKLAEAALAASIAERKAMEVEREIVDLYRAVMMKDRSASASRAR
jgi:ribonuclease R